MRQYIKAWITQRDLQRLIGASVRTVERPVESNYEEAEGLGESAPADTEEC
jgi:hypothetical protein